MKADPRASALFLGAFFDELARWGVRDVVVSPGSRSTPLAMCAYELARRHPERLRLFVDVDERGAAFFALGLAKASGRPAALVCTSGTAVANYYPAVLEAESSRVPLVVLTGDRPPRLQGLGAPQTCDQLKAYGDHVRAFRQMPLPTVDAAALAFARQAAREAAIAAQGEDALPDECEERRISGACFGGPVHLNFPFDEPLKPDLAVAGLFEAGRGPLQESLAEGFEREREPLEDLSSADLRESSGAQEAAGLGAMRGDVRSLRLSRMLDLREAKRIAALLDGRRVLVFAGEGTCATAGEAAQVLTWAEAFGLPLLADPLSGLRCRASSLVIDNYDSVLGTGGAVADELKPQVIIRFGRFPVSKKATQLVGAVRPIQIVVDPLETRDCNAATDVFVRCKPVECAGSLSAMRDGRENAYEPAAEQQAFADAWMAANDAAGARIAAVDDVAAGFEGAYVRRAVQLAPEGSCLFVGNSMSVRALDTFYLKENKYVTVLCNRGLNGIDGTVSTALGAAQYFDQTTLVVGDLALLHDLNALALQRELRVQREGAAARDKAPAPAAPESAPMTAGPDPAASADPDAPAAPNAAAPAAPVAPSIVIVLLNNNGGAIFDMLPQQSSDPYFERLFLTPQDVDFEAATRAFAVPHRRVETVAAFDEAYRALLGTPGIALIEVSVPLAGLKGRYAPYGA